MLSTSVAHDSTTMKIARRSATRRLRAVVPAALLLCASVLSFGASPSTLSSTAQVASGPDAQPEVAKKTLNVPVGVTVDNLGQIYVTNLLNSNVTIYSKNLKLVNTISGGMGFPCAVSIAFGGNIYVANTFGNNITIYGPNLQQIGVIDDPALQTPISMYVDGANNIWALTSDGTVHLYLDDGTPVSTAALPGSQAIGPWGSNVTVWGMSDGNGNYNEFVQNTGEAMRKGIEVTGYVIGPTVQAAGVAQDSLGQQYLTVPTSKLVEIQSSDGSGIIGTVSTASTGAGIAVDSVNQRFYVAEPQVNQVVVYSTKPPYQILGTIR